MNKSNSRQTRISDLHLSAVGFYLSATKVMIFIPKIKKFRQPAFLTRQKSIHKNADDTIRIEHCRIYPRASDRAVVVESYLLNRSPNRDSDTTYGGNPTHRKMRLYTFRPHKYLTAAPRNRTFHERYPPFLRATQNGRIPYGTSIPGTPSDDNVSAEILKRCGLLLL